MRHHHHHHHHHHDDHDDRSERKDHRESHRESRREHHRDDDRRRRPHRGPISRVVRGLAEQFNVHRHVIIAGFVLGFIFVPILTLLVFLAAVYWTSDPERFEEHFDRVAEKARDSYQAHFTKKDRAEPEAAKESYFRVPDFPELRRRFEELETRAQKMEAAVTTEEFSLNRRIRHIGQ